MSSDETRVKIIEAVLHLAAERSILTVGLTDIATKAGVSLAELRQRYDSRIAILEDFSRLIDQRVLAGHAGDLAGEPAKERLFDTLMRRFDALAPYRAGLRGLRRTAGRDPFFAAVLNHIAVGSQRWMLADAGLDPSGPFAPARRLARAQVLVLVQLRVLPVFLEDDEAGLPKTMAALDKVLAQVDRVAQVVHRLETGCDRILGRRTERRTPSAAPGPSTDGGIAEPEATPAA